MERAYYRNWMEFPHDLTGGSEKKAFLLGISVCVLMYIMGVLIAVFTGNFSTPSQFVVSYQAFHLAIIGLIIAIPGINAGGIWGRRVIWKLQNVAEIPDRDFFLVYKDMEKTVLNNFRCLIGGVVWFVWLLRIALVRYPSPILQFSPFDHYLLFDWYVLFVFLLVMFVLGSGCYMILGLFLAIRRIQWIPLNLARVEELHSIIRAFLYASAAWFACVAVSSPVLTILGREVVWDAISAQLAFGFIIFLMPVIFFKNSIAKTKQEKTSELRQLYSEKREEILGLIESGDKDLDTTASKALIFLSLESMINSIQEVKEWPIKLDTVIKLVGMSFLPIIVLVMMQRLI